MDEVLEWLSQSEYDLGTAQAMFDAERYNSKKDRGASFLGHILKQPEVVSFQPEAQA